MVLQGRDAEVKNGSFVFIRRDVEAFRDGKTFVETVRIPGKINHLTDDGSALVVHYGPPNHFSKSGYDFGIYEVKVPLSQLEEREPEIDDPKEFL